MIRSSPGSTLPDTLFPVTTLFRSDRAADSIERVDVLEPLIDVLSVLLEAGHREHDRGRRRCRESVDVALELVGVRPATKRRCPGLRELEYRPRELIENVD